MTELFKNKVETETFFSLRQVCIVVHYFSTDMFVVNVIALAEFRITELFRKLAKLRSRKCQIGDCE